MARILKVLELPERVLEALRDHAGDPRLRAHFTEKRLRQLVNENPGEAAILRELEQVIQGRGVRQAGRRPAGGAPRSPSGRVGVLAPADRAIASTSAPPPPA